MKIGIIGTGLMGLPMAQRLLQSGIAVVAYNRTSDKLEPLRQAGAAIADGVADLLPQCDAIATMLTNAQALEATLLSPEAQPHLRDRTVIQMSTIAPTESRRLGEAIATAGGNYLEAPVLGSIPEAKAGTLQVMVGATPQQYEQWLPLLKQFGEPRLIGPVGSASALKLALNQLIASLTTAFSQSLGFVQNQQVDVATFMDILRASALYAPTFDKKLQRMVERNFDHPNFPTKHLLKDTHLFLQEAQRAGIRADSLEGVQHILEMACQQGLADADYSALFAAVNPAANPQE